MFLSENPLDREMVHALTWLPVKMFTSSVMEAALDCWSWAIVARPELELLVEETCLFSRSASAFSFEDCRRDLQSLGESDQCSARTVFRRPGQFFSTGSHGETRSETQILADQSSSDLLRSN